MRQKIGGKLRDPAFYVRCGEFTQPSLSLFDLVSHKKADTGKINDFHS